MHLCLLLGVYLIAQPKGLLVAKWALKPSLFEHFIPHRFGCTEPNVLNRVDFLGRSANITNLFWFYSLIRIFQVS